MAKIVVVGAGVSGLTSAYLLAKKGNDVTVIAKHMPGDYDIEYASPWAGANVIPMASAENSRWERETWPELKRLATEVPEAGIHFQKSRIYQREKDLELIKKSGMSFDALLKANPWYMEMFPDFRELKAEELPGSFVSGIEFGSVCINTALYLPWLLGKCRASGVVFRRYVIKHISEAANLSHTGSKADIVINATGLLSAKLGGVEDASVVPIRGQIVVVRNEAPFMIAMTGSEDSMEEVGYIMCRPGGGGTVLGGTYQIGSWESQPDPNTAMRIIQRAVDAMPELTNGEGIKGIDIIRHGVGLRPHRKEGLRLEKEKIDDVWVVHNYGHAGWGYQGSYGCAEGVAELVQEIQTEAKQ